MHEAALNYVRRFQTTAAVKVLELGSRDVNGTPRALFPNADYTGVDVIDGPCVDIVADAADWLPDDLYDIVISTEVLEHAERWRDIVRTCGLACRPGGRVVLTAAGPGRGPHSAVDGRGLKDWEYYQNVDKPELVEAMIAAGFDDIDVEIVGTDIRGTGVKC